MKKLHTVNTKKYKMLEENGFEHTQSGHLSDAAVKDTFACRLN